VTTSDHGMRLV